MAKHPPETISISHFKATCLAVLEQVRRTGRPVMVTKHGQPIAQIVPPSAALVGASWMGSLRGIVTIAGDTISPAADDGEWEALR